MMIPQIYVGLAIFVLGILVGMTGLGTAVLMLAGLALAAKLLLPLIDRNGKRIPPLRQGDGKQPKAHQGRP